MQAWCIHVAHHIRERSERLSLVTHAASNPVHILGITRLRKDASVLRCGLWLALLWRLLLLLLRLRNGDGRLCWGGLSLLLLLSPTLFLLSALSLGTIIQQESQRARQRQDEQRVQNLRVDVVAEVVVAAGHWVVVVVVRFVVFPACDLGFEERRKPFSHRPFFLDD